MEDLPGENVLGVVISQVYLCCSADRYTFGGPVVGLDKILLHSLLDPNGLTSSEVCHFLYIGEVEFALLRIVVGSEHVLLPGFSQEALHSDLASGKPFRSSRLSSLVL